jgi:hypothetical protein
MKRRLSARETREFFAYVAINPIDFQSNFHFPIAQLEATLRNVNGANPQASFKDCLLFNRKDGDDLESQLINKF